MDGFVGMDTAAVLQLAAAITRAQGRLAELSGRLGSQVGSMPWQGADADAVRARWRGGVQLPLQAATLAMAGSARTLRGQVAQQDAASAAMVTVLPVAPPPSPVPRLVGGTAPAERSGYLHRNTPWLPDAVEGPVELLAHGAATDVLGDVRRADSLALLGLEQAGGRLGLQTAGLGQLRRDLDSFSGHAQELMAGERSPAVAELAAGGLLVGGSAAVGAYELATGEDIALLDDRRGGIIHQVRTDQTVHPAPGTLTDLVEDNNALRAHGTARSGAIGIQELRPRGSAGSDSVYLVQIPPTEGGGITSYDSWGAQGNSRDWASNGRLMAGQDVAAMDDVRAAMRAPGPDGRPLVPDGAPVVLVGHSQGGIIGAHLAADPRFNAAAGTPGSYNVQAAFSVGSPIQTVLPAQATTRVVNGTHRGEAGMTSVPLTVPGGVIHMPALPHVSGDLVGHLDLQGLRMDGTVPDAGVVQEVSAHGYPTGDPGHLLEDNHESVQRRTDGTPARDRGYLGTVERERRTDPALRSLEAELSGRILGPDVEVVRTSVVDVGREDRR